MKKCEARLDVDEPRTIEAPRIDHAGEMNQQIERGIVEEILNVGNLGDIAEGGESVPLIIGILPLKHIEEP